MDMGMTDKQFNGFLRSLIENVKDAKEEVQETGKTDKLEKVLEILEKTLED